MPIPFLGGCVCGEIRYTCSAEPLLVANCHCRDCQRASGSAFATTLPVKNFLIGERLPEPSKESNIVSTVNSR